MKRKLALPRLAALSVLAASISSGTAKDAAADVTLWKPETPGGGWEIFTNGRVGLFASYAKGDGSPQDSTYGDPILVNPNAPMPCDPITNPCTYMLPVLHQMKGGGLTYEAQEVYPVPFPDGTPSLKAVSKVNHMRIRSGFTGNVFGFGARRNLDPRTVVTAYISFTAVVDAEDQIVFSQRGASSFLDAREGYIKIDAPWGGVQAGRMGTLFNRGSVSTDYLLLHAYGVGYPGSVSTNGNFPTAGMIGFGVLANGFASGVVYSTPELAGVQLHLGAFDPAQLTGTGYERTKTPRYEFELAVDEQLGPNMKTHLYGTGGIQNHYKRRDTDDVVEVAKGYGFGGRFQVGPVQIGAGYHRGIGISATYMGIPGDETNNDNNQLRETYGMFGIGMVSVGKVDVSLGGGQTKLLVPNGDLAPNPVGYVNPATGMPDPKFSWINRQTAFAGAVVYHVTDYLHLDADVLFAEFKWNLGETQKINFYNAGATVTW